MLWSQRGLHFGPAGGSEATPVKNLEYSTKIFQIFIKIRENPLDKKGIFLYHNQVRVPWVLHTRERLQMR